ncbi:fatty acid desaturase [Halobacteriovorax sp. HLS]|uniref:fatty acid desaturase n=1 Tax=Halobacteriovorax sp. HLS TaxID=2234000 RepID=UPI000FD6D303|nr:fatty acid desaturase [Halobacteriovorax sp. HLS]
MNKYKKDPNYFLDYFINNIFIFSILIVALILIKNDYFSFNITGLSFLLIPVGLLLGLVVATAFHNASHGNIRPRILNTVVGELCGAIALDGMRNFRVGHMLHHIHSDDPILDPHPPHGLTFIEFIKTSKNKTISVLISKYYEYHGDTSSSRSNIEKQLICYKFSVVLKLVFWFLLLGPIGFFFFYGPTFLTYFLGFAHLNYISHGLDDKGDEVMFNHDGGVFYTFMNFMTAGGYYHKNHHKYPGLYNPKRIDLLVSNKSEKFKISDQQTT